MKRLEIVANRSIEEDLFDAFAKKEIGKHYTKIPIVHGVGRQGPRRGDHVWPEENFMLIIYCSEEESDIIKEVIKEVKDFFSEEGIKLFEMDAEQYNV